MKRNVKNEKKKWKEMLKMKRKSEKWKKNQSLAISQKLTGKKVLGFNGLTLYENIYKIFCIIYIYI